MDKDDTIPYTQFACIGTGFSGIALGATLQRWYGIDDIRFFERTADLGGTWSINRYPGAACDVPSGLYSFSFARNPNWTRILPTAPELHGYLRRVAGEYNIPTKTTFNTEVIRCEWLEEKCRWRVQGKNVQTGEVCVHECQFLFSGTGQFFQPRELDVPGLKNFKGDVVHSARWREDLDLKGKKVVVFGNGCTGAQIVPAIVDEVAQLTQIARSRHWIMPPIDAIIPRPVRIMLQHTPGMLAAQRFIIFVLAELDFPAFLMGRFSNAVRRLRQKMAEGYMRKAAPKRYLDMVIPEFELGCKRRIFDSGYLSSLHKPNMRLTNEAAVEILENGVRLGSGEVVEADTIVLANGFQTNEYLGNVDIIGWNGETLKQHWETFGGPEAYNCTSLSGFPNFFILLGMLRCAWQYGSVAD